jgi:hypothetical protein
MQKKFIKSIALTLAACSATLIGGNAASAATVEPNSIAASATSTSTIHTIKVTNFKDSVERINKVITINQKGIEFDANKASKEGFTNNEIKTLSKLYNEMNEMVKNKEASIVKTSNGIYDIKFDVNAINAKLNSSNINVNSIVTPNEWGYDFYFSPKECGDCAYILAGGAAVTGAIAATLGMNPEVPGATPAAIIAIVATGVEGLGAAYLGYCSNANGLDVNYNYIIGLTFHRNEN